MPKKTVGKLVVLIFALLLFVWWMIFITQRNAVNTGGQKTFRYVALGDSYSFGQGVDPLDAWPYQLADHLNNSGIPVDLYANLSQTGWTSKQLIDKALQGFILSRPDIGTLQIGANDWIQYVDKKLFTNRITYLMDEMVKALPSKDRLFVLTIPDFSVVKKGNTFGGGRNTSIGISEYNDIIKNEAENRGITVIDVFFLSQLMGGDDSLVAEDGLHPSAEEYAFWVEKIFPYVRRSLK